MDHERQYHWTGRALVVLLGLWVAAMLMAWGNSLNCLEEPRAIRCFLWRYIPCASSSDSHSEHHEDGRLYSLDGKISVLFSLW